MILRERVPAPEEGRRSPQLVAPISDLDHAFGPIDAFLSLVFYADFESPKCKRAYELLKRAKAAFKDELVLVFRHFPMSQHHPHARIAARAAESADLQNKFWEMVDEIFGNQGALDAENLLGYAELAGCDGDEYFEHVDDPEIDEKIEADFRGGLRSGVDRAPYLFLNGIHYAWDLEYGLLLAALNKARDGIPAVG